MTASNPTPWNGIPNDPDQSGWHWIGWTDYMEAHYWEAGRSSGNGRWEFPSGMLIYDFSKLEYLGPCTPPISRCRDGRRKVAVAAAFEFDYDSIRIKMNDGDNYFLDGYYWRNGAPIFEIVGKTIPEIDKAAAACRSPSQEIDVE